MTDFYVSVDTPEIGVRILSMLNARGWWCGRADPELFKMYLGISQRLYIRLRPETRGYLGITGHPDHRMAVYPSGSAFIQRYLESWNEQ